MQNTPFTNLSRTPPQAYAVQPEPTAKSYEHSHAAHNVTDSATDNATTNDYISVLRHEAIAKGLLSEHDSAWSKDDVVSDAAMAAIETLIDQQVTADVPDHDSCLRYYNSKPQRFAIGQKLHLQHILFAVTDGVDVVALRNHAEGVLLELSASKDPSLFAALSTRWSNCPSSQSGGDLGWTTEQDCAPEFAKAVFATAHIGLHPTLIHSRFGFHIVNITAIDAGRIPAFEEIAKAVALQLEQQSWSNHLRQYVQQLAVSQGVNIQTVLDNEN